MSAASETVAGTVRIRRAVPQDVPRLLALMRALATYEDCAAALNADEASLSRDGFGAVPRYAALLAEVDADVAGYVTYTTGYSIWAARTTLLVDDVFVADGYRGLGIGRELMAAVGRICVEDGHAFARWTVEVDNAAAIAFYERLGARVSAKGLCTWIPSPPSAR
ncbi:MAG TPA: GNAT family N-acetyltransferase [Lysobacter sp.]|nr:GNAT family N-acetyltransferase [Lysobacter sp.]